MQDLLTVLASLGLEQYADTFITEGFDSWKVLCDITEADLDCLDVKRGHRRILQRAITESREPSRTRAPATTSTTAAAGPAVLQTELSNSSTQSDSASRSANVGKAQPRTKRKYRRHAKPDPNAPEKPPSAYVVFSNRTREELKDHCLSFTDMAKAVGHRWQGLPAEEREAYEQHAAAEKEHYIAQMTEYRKTERWAQYNEYFNEFKRTVGANQQDGKRSKIMNSDHNAARGEGEYEDRVSRSISGDDDRSVSALHQLSPATTQYTPQGRNALPAIHTVNPYPRNSPGTTTPQSAASHDFSRHVTSYPGDGLSRPSPSHHNTFRAEYSPHEHRYSSHVRGQLSTSNGHQSSYTTYHDQRNEPLQARQPTYRHDHPTHASDPVHPYPQLPPGGHGMNGVPAVEDSAGALQRMLPPLASLQESARAFDSRMAFDHRRLPPVPDSKRSSRADEQQGNGFSNSLPPHPVSSPSATLESNSRILRERPRQSTPSLS